MIILDTNVLSELMRTGPDLRVQSWVDSQLRAQLYTTVITQAELLYGVEIAPAGRRREQLQQAVQRMLSRLLAGHVLSFDNAAAEAFAPIAARRRKLGRPIDHPDAQIAAIVRIHNASLATRNISDFANCGIELIDPWQAQR